MALLPSFPTSLPAFGPAQVAQPTILIKRARQIATIIPNVIIEEIHRDELMITDHPVEKGAIISDHAFKTPEEVVMRVGWSNSDPRASGESYIDDIYAQLIDLQKSAVPFDVYTGKRKYPNMLLRSLLVTTDRTKENILEVTAILRQVILVDTQVIPVSSDPHLQSNPAATQPTAEENKSYLMPANPNGSTTTVGIGPTHQQQVKVKDLINQKPANAVDVLKLRGAR